MYVLIVGAGRVGSVLARWLLTAEHEVTVVDRDPIRCAVLDEELGSITVVGDGTDAGVLAKAGANRAEIFIATTRRDDDNLVACQLARHHFRAEHTVALVNIADHERLFNRLGVDITISVTELLAGRIQDLLSGFLVEEVGEFA